jgi:rhamnosyl/mannosyltransferase
MRICHLGKYNPPAPGGIEAHVRTLAAAQAALGATVEVVCINHRPGPSAVEADGPVAVVRSRRVAAVAKLDVCPGLPATLARVRADVLHLHVPNPTMILALLACGRARRTPVVVTYHSDLIRQRLLGALFRPLERRAYRRVRAVLPTSPAYAAGSAFLASYAERLHVLPHGIDLEPYLRPSAADRAAAAALRAAHRGPIWLGCGRLVPYKGLRTALAALAGVEGTLLIVGEGPDRPALEAEAARRGLGRRLAFVGAVPRVVPYYLAASALWFPSNARSEAFGLVQVEAMASGCPVLNAAIPHSGVPWVSPHEQTGLTVPVDDPAALAAAARRLIAEPGLRDRLAASARARAVAEFDHRVMARRSLAIYDHVLAAAVPAVDGGRWTIDGVAAVDGGR